MKQTKNLFKNYSLLILSLLIILTTINTASAQVTQDDLLDGLVSYWDGSFSGTTAIDVHGSNNGTASNSRVLDATGKIGKGFDFSQGDDYINSNLNNLPNEAFTLSTWVYSNNISSMLLLDKTSGTSYATREFILQNTDTGKIQLVIGDGSSWRVNLITSESLVANNWTHIVASHDGSSQKIYINGIEVASSSISFTRLKGSNNLYINHNLQYDTTFKGLLDEAAVYNRALNSTEIFTLYDIQKDGYTDGSYNFSALAEESNFTIYLTDANTGASINDFSVSVNGTAYSTSSGEVVTDLEINSNLSVDLSFYNIGGGLGSETHYSFSVSNVSSGSNYVGEADQFVLFVRDVFTNETLNGSIYSRATACVDPPCGFLNSGSFVNGEYKGVLNDAGTTENDLILVVDDYYNKTFDFYDLTIPLNTSMTPYYYIISEDYTGIVNYSSDAFVRSFDYSLSVVCPSFINSSFTIFATNNTEVYTPNCNNETSFIISGTYTHFEEGAFNFTLGVNSSEDDLSVNASTLNLISDLFDPIINASMVLPEGFNEITTQLSLVCTDNISPVLNYSMVYNDDLIYNDTKTANTTQSNNSQVSHGINEFDVRCDDFFNYSSSSLTQRTYFKNIQLIDEVDNVAFNVANLSSARLYYDDNSSFYDFQDESANSVNFTSTNMTQLRLELGYPENRFITRWIDVALFSTTNPLRICANKDNVIHYEQFITSSVLKSVFLKNIYANCYVAGDQTRFAFKDGLILRAYTITGAYSLFTITGLEQVLLASVDGAIQSDIFLDQLQFRRESFTVSILPDLISFNKVDVPEGALRIYYLNKNLDNFGLTINIKHGQTGDLLFSESSFVNFNEASILFNYATISGINESTLLILEVIKTDEAGQTTTLRRFFNITGSTGKFRPEVVSFIAFFVLLFGFTFTSSQQTFGWFGMIIGILTFGFLSFAISAWYVVFLQALSASLIIYCVIMLSKDTAGGFFT